MANVSPQLVPGAEKMLSFIAMLLSITSTTIVKDEPRFADLRVVLISSDKSVKSKVSALRAIPNCEKGTVPISELPFIESFTKHEDAEVRRYAMEALSVFGAQGVPSILKLLNHKDDGTFYYATLTLATMKKDAASAVPSLVDYIDRVITRKEINVVRNDGTARRAVQCINALKEMDPDADAIIKPGRAWMLKYLYFYKNNFSEEVVSKATYLTLHFIEKSGGSHGKECVQPMIELIGFPVKRHNIITTSIKALGAVGPDAKAALPRLRELLKEKGKIGEEAEKAIGLINKP